MKKKRILATGLIGILIFSMAATAFAQDKIFIDLEEVVTDTPPQIINERTMVPVRAITQMIGCEVEWIKENNQVEVYEKDGKEPIIVMVIGSKVAWQPKFVEELGETMNAEIELDTPAAIINDRTFVPLRFISEAIGYTVDYNVDSTDIYMFSPTYMQNQAGEGVGSGDGEGIGSVAPLTENEKNYVLSLRTKSWTKLTEIQQNDVISMILRWWETTDGYTVENIDEVYDKIGRQMGQYFKSETDMGVFETACELQGIDINKYVEIMG